MMNLDFRRAETKRRRLPRFSETTRRDWNNVKLAAMEFVDDMRDPRNLVMLIIASAVVAGFMLLPWLATDDDSRFQIPDSRSQSQAARR